MKIIKIVAAMLTLACFLSTMYAQSITDILTDETKNFFEKDSLVLSKLLSNKEQIQKSSIENQAIKENKELIAYYRWKWYWGRRVDRTGDTKKMGDAFSKISYSNATAIQATTQKIMTKSTINLVWECIGPIERPIGDHPHVGMGKVEDLWINPDDYDHILAGANSGGLWKTTNGGANWVCLTDNIICLGVKDILVHPTNNNVIYIGSGKNVNGLLGANNFDMFSQGIFKTTDGGGTWSKCTINNFDNNVIEALLMHPNNNSVIYALSSRNVYKSTNAGASFNKCGSIHLSNIELTDFEFCPNQPNTMYVGGRNALLRSTDGGTSWSDISSKISGLPASYRAAISIDKQNPNDLYVLLTNDKIYKSTDNGNNFSFLGTDYFRAENWTCEITVGPDSMIYAGGLYHYISQDGGNTFEKKTGDNIHVDVQDVVFPDPENNNLIFNANDGGIYKSINGGDTWEFISGNMGVNEFYKIAITEQDKEFMLGGTHDCGTYKHMADGKWYFESGGDAGTALIDHSDKDIYYYTSNYGYVPLFRYNHGVRKKIYNVHPQMFDVTFVQDPNNDILYLANWENTGGAPVKLKKSTNKGDSWTTIDQVWENIRCIAIPKCNSDVIYYATSATWNSPVIKKSVDAGVNWSITGYSGIEDILEKTFVNNIEVDPNNENQLWIVFSGFEENKKVYESSDGGNNWTNISYTGLPNLPMLNIKYDFLNKRLFVGTDAGIYILEEGTNNWVLAEGFPRAIVSDMKLNTASGDLVVASYGRGIWRTNLGGGYCYNAANPIVISDIETWTEDREVCSNIIVEYSSQLTINSAVTCPYNGSITVEYDGTLIIDGGSVKYGNITVKSGGTLILKNNGIIQTYVNDEIDIKQGAVFEQQYGEIQQLD